MNYSIYTTSTRVFQIYDQDKVAERFKITKGIQLTVHDEESRILS